MTGCVNVFAKAARRSFCSTKSYDNRKCQIFDLSTVFRAFLDNYPAKSIIIGLVERTGY